MNTSSDLIFIDQPLSDQGVTNESYWNYFKDTAHLLNNPLQNREQQITELVYEIQKHPKDLKAHIQRIFFCYQDDLTDPLFAALVDFLIVLDKRGKHISRRMMAGSASKLSAEQNAVLTAAINDEISDMSLLNGNCYSVYCQGLIGTVNLVDKQNAAASSNLDPLKLAEDAVEYSQLDEAMDILESAIAENPERMELHDFLLELYKSTNKQTRFEQTFARLRDLDPFLADQSISDSWNQLKNYFER